jgi:hypothetical protein
LPQGAGPEWDGSGRQATKITNIFKALTGKERFLLPDIANRVKGLFVAVPQIARNSTTTPSNNP